MSSDESFYRTLFSFLVGFNLEQFYITHVFMEPSRIYCFFSRRNKTKVHEPYFDVARAMFDKTISSIRLDR